MVQPRKDQQLKVLIIEFFIVKQNCGPGGGIFSLFRGLKLHLNNKSDVCSNYMTICLFPSFLLLGVLRWGHSFFSNSRLLAFYMTAGTHKSVFGLLGPKSGWTTQMGAIPIDPGVKCKHVMTFETNYFPHAHWRPP